MSFENDNIKELKDLWKKANQGHVLKFESSLSDDAKEKLYSDMKTIDVTRFNEIYKTLSDQSENDGVEDAEGLVEPMEMISHEDMKPQIAKWNDLGYKAILKGKVAALLMAGGQGTRLGSNNPKGMFDVGLPSSKSLFQLQAERILSVQKLAQTSAGGIVEVPSIPWYIMLSKVVERDTVHFFKSHSFFGLKESQVHFFIQDQLPCLTPEGKILLESGSKIATAPNGNGGLWYALYEQKILEDMERKGIEWLASYCVDNILIKMVDPIFLGFCIDEKVKIASKVVKKTNPNEKVGVLAFKNGKPQVIEYSEIDEEKREARKPVNKKGKEGELIYNTSHLAINTFSLSFVKEFCETQLRKLPFHIARKCIPCANDKGEKEKPLDGKVNGWKLEMFVFDIFPFCPKEDIRAFEVEREREFSPLKNNEKNSTVSNAATCRADISTLHRQWIEAAGGNVIVGKDGGEGVVPVRDGVPVVEVSPLVSYSGENLKELVYGKELKCPVYLQ